MMPLADAKEARLPCRRIMTLHQSVPGDSRLKDLPCKEVSRFLNHIGTSLNGRKAQVDPVNFPGGAKVDTDIKIQRMPGVFMHMSMERDTIEGHVSGSNCS